MEAVLVTLQNLYDYEPPTQSVYKWQNNNKIFIRNVLWLIYFDNDTNIFIYIIKTKYYWNKIT